MNIIIITIVVSGTIWYHINVPSMPNNDFYNYKMITKMD
jgi:hypothetical protein